MYCNICNKKIEKTKLNKCCIEYYKIQITPIKPIKPIKPIFVCDGNCIKCIDKYCLDF